MAGKEIALRVVEDGGLPRLPKALRKKQVEEGKKPVLESTKVHWVTNFHVKNRSLCGITSPPFFVDEQTVVPVVSDCISCEKCAHMYQLMKL